MEGTNNEEEQRKAMPGKYGDFHLALLDEDPRKALKLLQEMEDLEAVDHNQWTPLHWAASVGNGHAVAYLLEKGVNPSPTDLSHERTPLHAAAARGAEICINQLVKAGADVNEADDDGNTPLHVACQNEEEDCAAALVNSGAIVNARNLSGRTPLHEAVVRDMTSTIFLLAQKSKSDVDQRTIDGNTPLHFAVRAGKSRSVKQLLEQGANPRIRNRDGKSSIDLAEGNPVIQNDLLQTETKEKKEVSKRPTASFGVVLALYNRRKTLEVTSSPEARNPSWNPLMMGDAVQKLKRKNRRPKINYEEEEARLKQMVETSEEARHECIEVVNQLKEDFESLERVLQQRRNEKRERKEKQEADYAAHLESCKAQLEQVEEDYQHLAKELGDEKESLEDDSSTSSSDSDSSTDSDTTTSSSTFTSANTSSIENTETGNPKPIRVVSEEEKSANRRKLKTFSGGIPKDPNVNSLKDYKAHPAWRLPRSRASYHPPTDLYNVYSPSHTHRTMSTSPRADSQPPPLSSRSTPATASAATTRNSTHPSPQPRRPQSTVSQLGLSNDFERLLYDLRAAHRAESTPAESQPDVTKTRRTKRKKNACRRGNDPSKSPALVLPSQSPSTVLPSQEWDVPRDRLDGELAHNRRSHSPGKRKGANRMIMV